MCDYWKRRGNVKVDCFYFVDIHLVICYYVNFFHKKL